MSQKDFNPGFENHAFLTHGIQNPYQFSYRGGGILDVIRAIDFIEFYHKDGNDITIYMTGGSQGGGIALAATALDNRIRGCMADIPFITDFRNSFKIAQWPYSVFKNHADKENYPIDSILSTLDYFDTKNFFPKIEVPILISIGLQGDICPPRMAFSLID